MLGLGRILIFTGIVIVLIGVGLLLAGRFQLPFGRLPGDFHWQGKSSSFYFPLTTCILISAVLSLILYIVGRIHR